MKCINCGAEIKPEFKVCPYCGTTIQIVPDYSADRKRGIGAVHYAIRSAEDPR